MLVGDEEPISRLPYRPIGGSVFKYLNDDGPEDGRADGHKWFNQGTTSLPRTNPLVKKNYFYIQTETGGASRKPVRFWSNTLEIRRPSNVFPHKNSKPDKATVFARSSA